MKNYLILLLICIANLLAAQNFTFNPIIAIETSYNSNILNLSQSDLDRFKSGNESDKFALETSDDLITSAKVELNLKHRLFAGHTQIDRIAVKYNKYLKNGFKDDYHIEFMARQYLSKKFNIGVYYFFYPKIYVNRYDSLIDDENIFRDFTYSKNNYLGKINYTLNAKYQINYKFGFSQLCYNEYFTEYDAENIENGIGIKVIPANWIRINSSYKFKISKAKASDAFSNPEQVSTISDASYQVNYFDLSLVFPKIISVFSNPIDLGFNAKFERYYFQTNNELDEYHYGRNDKIININSDTMCKISNHVSLKYFYKYTIRKTGSPYPKVEEDKEYKTFETGISINLFL